MNINNPTARRANQVERNVLSSSSYHFMLGRQTRQSQSLTNCFTLALMFLNHATVSFASLHHLTMN